MLAHVRTRPAAGQETRSITAATAPRPCYSHRQRQLLTNTTLHVLTHLTTMPGTTVAVGRHSVEMSSVCLSWDHPPAQVPHERRCGSSPYIRPSLVSARPPMARCSAFASVTRRHITCSAAQSDGLRASRVARIRCSTREWRGATRWGNKNTALWIFALSVGEQAQAITHICLITRLS